MYKAECAELLRRYRLGRISHSECINALASAVAALAPTLRPEGVDSLRSTILANNDEVKTIRGRKPN